MRRARHLDAGLLALGRDLENSWNAEQSAIRNGRTNEAQIAASVESSSAIVERIAKTPAFTLGGLRVKARAYSWTQCDDPAPLALANTGVVDTTEDRVLHSILRDLSIKSPRRAKA